MKADIKRHYLSGQRTTWTVCRNLNICTISQTGESEIREITCGNSIVFSANRLQYASNTTKLQVSTQLFDRALLNRNSVMDIWNMPHVENGDKYYIRKEYTEVSELGKDGTPKLEQIDGAIEPGTGEVT